jgi:galactosamine-6-phosphate isomerase
VEFVTGRDCEAMSRRAAAVVERAARETPGLVLCAATGASPTRTYEMLGEAARREPSLFTWVRVVKLDEWGGLPPSHPSTCETYLRRHLLGPLRVPDARYVGFRSDEPDPQGECDRVGGELSRMRIDLCVLGLGVNGHLGFNEPGDWLLPHAHVAPLSAESQSHPMVRDAGVRVRYGLTLGMADILGARKVLLLVSGAHKRGPLRKLKREEVSTHFPASFLWLHPDATCVCDAEAAGSGSDQD